jgi:hypothetical protein
VIAPRTNVDVLNGAHGLPQATQSPDLLLPPGQGWEYFTAGN